MPVLKDALYNLHPESKTAPEYAQGLLVGVLAAVMEFKACTFHEAVRMVSPHLPKHIMPQAVPTGWDQSLLK